MSPGTTFTCDTNCKRHAAIFRAYQMSGRFCISVLLTTVTMLWFGPELLIAQESIPAQQPPGRPYEPALPNDAGGEGDAQRRDSGPTGNGTDKADDRASEGSDNVRPEPAPPAFPFERGNQSRSNQRFNRPGADRQSPSRFDRSRSTDRRQRLRLARVPNMFGDFFGSGQGSATIPVFVPGVTDGATGTASFLDVSVTSGGPGVFNYAHPGFGNLVEIDVPSLGVLINGTNDVPFDIDIPGTPPPPTVSVSVDPATLNQINSTTNAPAVAAQYHPLIIAEEQLANPLVTDVITSVAVDGDIDAVGDGIVTDLDFSFALSSVVSTTTMAFTIPSPSAGGAFVGRQKIAENSSPLPRDRVFVNYSHFDDVRLARGGVDVNRVVPGVEKTFMDGQGSVELRFPFASTLSSTIFSDASTDASHVEFGNITAGVKLLLWERDSFAICGGLVCALPTADDTIVQLANGPPLIVVDNQAVNLLPYLGGLWMPNDRIYFQGFVQCDVQANPNPVRINNTGAGLARAGRIDDPSLLYLDAAIGYWLLRKNGPKEFLRAIIPTAELHYNSTLESQDVVAVGAYQVGTFAQQVDVLNMVLGTTFLLGDNTRLGIGYATGIGNRADQQFDGELRVTLDVFPSRQGARLPPVP